MRIASLLPSATELCCSLGLRDQLVAISHECDYPSGFRLTHVFALISAVASRRHNVEFMKAGSVAASPSLGLFMKYLIEVMFFA